ncbi:MAG: hypothetical protein JNK15_08935, partial [Planctomycetes bacterium]|nr:hypothetical protein [Planctomycetota bacterium]
MDPTSPIPTDTWQKAARDVLMDLNLRELDHSRRLVSGHRSSLPLVAEGQGGRQ